LRFQRDLVYLAKKTGRTGGCRKIRPVLPPSSDGFRSPPGQIATGRHRPGPRQCLPGALSSEEVIPRSHAILALIENALDGREWIAADRPTIADIGLYSYVERAPEGMSTFSLSQRPRQWLGAIEALPGFIEFQKTPVGLEA